MVNHPLSSASRALAKNGYVLPVAEVITRFSDGRFTKRQVAGLLNVNDNLVTAPFERLADLGAIKFTGQVDLDGQWYERLKHPIWKFVAALMPPS